LKYNPFKKPKKMKTKLFKKEITVQKYEFGKPFPGLYSELVNLPKLPEASRQKGLEGGMSGKFGVVLTQSEGLVLVPDGAYMQISEPMGGLNLPQCLGRIPEGYKLAE